jgi:hypothetical protein
MSFETELNALTDFVPIEKLHERLVYPLKFMPEEPYTLLPTIEVRGDGLALARMLLVSERFLCDVPLPLDSEFDYVQKNTIENFRLRIWDHVVNQPESGVVVATYQIAAVNLLHRLGLPFTTNISYAGQDREKWLEKVLEAIPVKILLERA